MDSWKLGQAWHQCTFSDERSRLERVYAGGMVNARSVYSKYLNADEYRVFADEFRTRNGRSPTKGEQLNAFAKHLGSSGPETTSVFGIADESSTRPGMTHFEAMVDEVLNDPRANFLNDSESKRERVRKEIANVLEDTTLAFVYSAKMRGGPELLEDGSPNPEHGKQFSGALPGYIRINQRGDPGYSTCDVMVASVNSFGPGLDTFTDASIPNSRTDIFGGLRRSEPGFTPGNGARLSWRYGSQPLWALNDGEKFLYSISMDTLFLTRKRNVDGFLPLAADSKLNHIDDFAREVAPTLEVISKDVRGLQSAGAHSASTDVSGSDYPSRQSGTPLERKLAELDELLVDGLIKSEEHAALRRHALGLS